MSKAAVIAAYLRERLGEHAVESVSLQGRQLRLNRASSELTESWHTFDEFCRFWDGAPPEVLLAVENVQSVRLAS